MIAVLFVEARKINVYPVSDYQFKDGTDYETYFKGSDNPKMIFKTTSDQTTTAGGFSDDLTTLVATGDNRIVWEIK